MGRIDLPEPRDRPDRIDALTSVRFFFAAMVFLDHFVAYYWPTGRIPFAYAGVGVSWFFVLSGFIIAHNYPRLTKPSDRFAFIALRIARLWPVHATILLFLLLAVPDYRGAIWALPFNATLTHTWIPIPAINGSFNGPSWSISTELFFYLIFVLLTGPRWLRWVAVIVPIALSLMLSIGFDCWPEGSITGPLFSENAISCSSILYTFPPSRLLEFISGVALRSAYPHIKTAASNLPTAVVSLLQLAAIAGTLCLVEIFISQISAKSAPGVMMLRAATIASGVVIVCALSVNGALARLLSSRVMIFAGEISFALYMVHLPVMLLLRPHVDGMSLLPVLTILIVTTLVLSSALFLLVERPTRNAVKRYLRGHNYSSVHSISTV